METAPRLAAPSRKFAEVVPERSRTFLPDGIPRSASAAVIYIQTLDSSAASRHMNAAVPFLHLTPSRRPSPPPTSAPSALARHGGQCQGGATSNAGREGAAESGRGTDAERRVTNRIVHQSKTEPVKRKRTFS